MSALGQPALLLLVKSEVRARITPNGRLNERLLLGAVSSTETGEDGPGRHFCSTTHSSSSVVTGSSPRGAQRHRVRTILPMCSPASMRTMFGQFLTLLACLTATADLFGPSVSDQGWIIRGVRSCF